MGPHVGEVTPQFDLLVIGGGINGAGIARDAAGRGLKVVLVEKDDLAAATSSQSSKLIHGGLRYLEQYEFRLVAEALAEREVLMSIAPHLVRPLCFVMPHQPELRPRWLIRAGLFLYDHLGRRTRLPKSHGIALSTSPYGAGLQPGFARGFIYSDCRVDDARLVLANAMSARELGAEINTRTKCASAERSSSGWQVRVTAAGGSRMISARAIVNAAGPWVKEVLHDRLHQRSADDIRLVQGSHIVVNKLYDGDHAYILQNDDRRVVFMIPYERAYTLIGTTDVPVEQMPEKPAAGEDEITYLCRAANRYMAIRIKPADVVWSYAGVRPLHDDGTAAAAEITRDYALRVKADGGAAPVLSVFGGKITTYRKLAEHALEKLTPWFPTMRPAWTATIALPGCDRAIAKDPDGADTRTRINFPPWMPPAVCSALASRHGSCVSHVIANVRSIEDLGEYFGAELYAREVDYMIEREWAQTADDILYRRTKAGLVTSPSQQQALGRYIAMRLAAQ